jgi:hypothetical protein
MGFAPKKFAALRPQLRRIFEISSLDKIRAFHKTVNDAVTAFEGEA